MLYLKEATDNLQPSNFYQLTSERQHRTLDVLYRASEAHLTVGQLLHTTEITHSHVSKYNNVNDKMRVSAFARLRLVAKIAGVDPFQRSSYPHTQIKPA
jgi:hypothetical protein